MYVRCVVFWPYIYVPICVHKRQHVFGCNSTTPLYVSVCIKVTSCISCDHKTTATSFLGKTYPTDSYCIALYEVYVLFTRKYVLCYLYFSMDVPKLMTLVTMTSMSFTPGRMWLVQCARDRFITHYAGEKCSWLHKGIMKTMNEWMNRLMN